MQPTILESTLPLPPPPPLPQQRNNRNIFLAVAIAIVIVVAASVAIYVAMSSSPDHGEGGPGPSFLPSTAPSSAATPTPTVNPTFNPLSTGYRNGAWANYTMKDYDATGRNTAQYTLSYSVSEGARNGVGCWILRTEQQTSSELSGQTYTALTVTTYWLDKATLEGVHYRIEVYSNGQQITVTENDYQAGDFNSIPTSINPSTVVNTESVTVPAGTFTCDKAVTTTTDLGNQYVITVWGSQNVPIVGLVKQEMVQNGVLISTTELTAYGG